MLKVRRFLGLTYQNEKSLLGLRNGLWKLLKNEFGYLENKDYEREIKFYSFSLDFVFPGKKVIEIDGSQHKRSEYQKDCDRRKDEKLKQDGWKELRIDWDECFKNPKESLQSVKAFLEIA